MLLLGEGWDRTAQLPMVLTRHWMGPFQVSGALEMANISVNDFPPISCLAPKNPYPLSGSPRTCPRPNGRSWGSSEQLCVSLCCAGTILVCEHNCKQLSVRRTRLRSAETSPNGTILSASVQYLYCNLRQTFLVLKFRLEQGEKWRQFLLVSNS